DPVRALIRRPVDDGDLFIAEQEPVRPHRGERLVRTVVALLGPAQAAVALLAGRAVVVGRAAEIGVVPRRAAGAGRRVAPEIRWPEVALVTRSRHDCDEGPRAPHAAGLSKMSARP